MISVLFVLLLSFHLVCMNVASAGPIVCIWLDRQASRQSEEASAVMNWLAWKAVQLALLGAITGLVMGWLKWDPQYVDILRRFEIRLKWGVAEFLFSLLLMIGYASWLTRTHRPPTMMRWLRSSIALLAATNLLYHFPTLFSLIANAAAGRGPAVTVDSPTFRKLIAAGDVMAITTHFAVASFAITGTMLMFYAWSRSGDDPPVNVAKWGARLALVATLCQIPAGIWLVVAIPAAAQNRLMGGDWIGSGLLVVSILAILSLLHYLAAVSFGERSRGVWFRSIAMMLVVVLLMTGVLHRLNV